MTQNYRGIEELGGIRHQHRVVVVDRIGQVMLLSAESCVSSTSLVVDLVSRALWVWPLK